MLYRPRTRHFSAGCALSVASTSHLIPQPVRFASAEAKSRATVRRGHVTMFTPLMTRGWCTMLTSSSQPRNCGRFTSGRGRRANVESRVQYPPRNLGPHPRSRGPVNAAGALDPAYTVCDADDDSPWIPFVRRWGISIAGRSMQRRTHFGIVECSSLRNGFKPSRVGELWPDVTFGNSEKRRMKQASLDAIVSEVDFGKVISFDLLGNGTDSWRCEPVA